MPHDGGLGTHIVGDKITLNHVTISISKMIGEGGFSYVYLAKEAQEGASLTHSLHLVNKGDKKDEGDSNGANNSRKPMGKGAIPPGEKQLCLKVTSIHSRSQRDIAEKEAKLLSRLSHPSIIKMYDTCYRSVAHLSSKRGNKDSSAAAKDRPQHLILMEFCEGGHALNVCERLKNAGKRFDLSTLIIAFGQICNAVSYLHAQRPPIVHRDLKPVNFLVKNGAYKLCDFGSAVFGHVDVRTPRARAEAQEIIEKTTTQMFRSPEMVDLYMAKKLTQSTDVWALGCCLYSLAFLQNCFEEGSNLAIISRKYTIPDDNPYGDGLVELLDRMLTVDCRARADMTEVILCLSAVYSGKPLPPRKKQAKPIKKEGKEEEVGAPVAAAVSKEEKVKKDMAERFGTFRTDGQGVQGAIYDPTKASEGKKLNQNSVAARRKRAAAGTAVKPPTAPSSSTGAPTTTTAGAAATTSEPIGEFGSFHSRFSDKSGGQGEVDQNLAFSTTSNPFGDIKAFDSKPDSGAKDFFGSFDNAAENTNADVGASEAFAAAFDAWGEGPATGGDQDPSSLAQDGIDAGDDGNAEDFNSKERSRRRKEAAKGKGSRADGAVDDTVVNSTESGVEVSTAASADAADKKERRSRRTDDEEKDHRRRRSGSRGRRKLKQQIRDPRLAEKTDKPIKATDKSDTGEGMKKSGSLRNMFNR